MRGSSYVIGPLKVLLPNFNDFFFVSFPVVDDDFAVDIQDEARFP